MTRPDAKEHIRLLNEFLLADVIESVADEQRWIDDAAARGDERGCQMYREWLDRSLATKARLEAELAA